MTRARGPVFSVYELLSMAALAALGGASSSVVSLVGRAFTAAVGMHGGFQFLAGIHVLWLVLALGLVRKPGTATLTGLLKGGVELLTGNPHGLIVVAISGLAGAVVDTVWLLLACRHHPVTYVVAGGLGAASNVLVLKVVGSLSAGAGMTGFLWILGGVAFVSGALLAGLLGWWLLGALRAAGITVAQAASSPRRGGRRAWAGIGVLGLVIVLLFTATYLLQGATPAAAHGSRGEPGTQVPVKTPG